MTVLSVSGELDLPVLDGMSAVISIRNPGDELPDAVSGLDCPVLELVFHDTDGDVLDDAPEIWHLREVERFLRSLRSPERLHVHCFAGISRSTAVASFALAVLQPALSDARIVRQVLAVRSQAVPNEEVLRCADELLNRNLRSAWRRSGGRY